MKDRILENLDNPENLEILYRENKQEFTKAFSELSANDHSELIRFWNIRLSYEQEQARKGTAKWDLIILIALSLITGLLVKLPELFPKINSDFFYKRDLAIIIFNGLILYVFWQNKLFNIMKLLAYGITISLLLLYVNLLPMGKSDSMNLVFIHVPFLLWYLFGLSFISFDHHNMIKRLNFIRFNGEFMIMLGLILFAGGMLTVLTLKLFLAINMSIQQFYFNYVVVFGSITAILVAFYLIRLYPSITNKIAPVVAKIFAPLVLITLTIYLIFSILPKNNVIMNRDELIFFNGMLFGVMAIIVFSISELVPSKIRDVNVLILFLLSVVSIVINVVALISISTRFSNGLTPNRIVVLGSNILILVNLILISINLFKTYFNGDSLNAVGKIVANYLSVYLVWIILVIFVLPFVFGLR